MTLLGRAPHGSASRTARATHGRPVIGHLIAALALGFGVLLAPAYAQPTLRAGKAACANPTKPLVIQVEFPGIGRRIDSSDVRRCGS
jgi:hypothetical protein